MRITVTAPDKFVMADVVETTLRYARRTNDQFVCGPFREAELLRSGWVCEGAVEGLVGPLRAVSGATVVTDDG